MYIYLLLALLAVPAVALDCPKGSIDVGGGRPCADMPSPKESALAPAIGLTISDEQPSHHPQSAIERGEIIADMRAPETANDLKKDLEKLCATLDGKKKGKVPLTDEEKATLKDQCDASAGVK